jgi:hypothetical protein
MPKTADTTEPEGPTPEELDAELDAIPATVEPDDGHQHEWLNYMRPVVRHLAGEVWNVKCRLCGSRAWRG